MNTGKYIQKGWILIGILPMIVALACNLSLRKQEKPIETIPVSTESAGAFEATITQAVEDFQKGNEIDLSFSETEITSYLNIKLREQTQNQFSDPQIYLRDGKAQVFINYHSDKIILPLKVVLSPQVDSDGNARLVVDSMDMGGITAPDSLEKMFQDEVDRALTQALSQAGENLKVESLTIQDGYLNIRGVKR